MRAYKAQLANERARIVDEYLPVIKHFAYKLTLNADEAQFREDLVSAGVIGLLEAMERFDPSKGAKLKTYAYLRIRGAMVDEIRAKSWYPRSAWDKTRKIEAAITNLEKKLGRYPDEEEIAREMGIDIEEYMKVIGNCGNMSVVSLEKVFESQEDSREKILDYIMGNENSPDDFAAIHEIEKFLGEQIDNLPERLKQILSLYYYEDMNMKEIGEVFGISEARVCQLHGQAIMNLRTAMAKYR
jgi:RNA polymerase sigma factor for flagellar operon FliA